MPEALLFVILTESSKSTASIARSEADCEYLFQIKNKELH